MDCIEDAICEIESLIAEIKANNKTYRMAQDRANNDIETLTANLHVQEVANSRLQIQSNIFEDNCLTAEGRAREDAMYRFMRHIQDQIEKHAGWMQFDFYVPQVDAYEYNQFVEALGDKGDHARWSELLERYVAVSTQQSSEFSEFIRNASPEEKEAVFEKVIDDANAEQASVLPLTETQMESDGETDAADTRQHETKSYCTICGSEEDVHTCAGSDSLSNL